MTKEKDRRESERRREPLAAASLPGQPRPVGRRQFHVDSCRPVIRGFARHPLFLGNPELEIFTIGHRIPRWRR